MNAQPDREIHIDEQDATAGSKPGVMRWVLGISLLLAVAILSAIWITGAASQPEDSSESPRTAVVLDSTLFVV